MYFESIGNGNPILLIHGFCEDLTIWKDLSKSLSETNRVITIDLPGFGKSPLTDKSANLQDVASEVANFIKLQKIEGCFAIGHSLGGYVSLALADSHSHLISGIGLFHSTTFPDSDEKREVREKAIIHVQKHGIHHFSKGFVPNLFYNENHSLFKKEIEQLKLVANQTDEQTFVTYARAMKTRNDYRPLWAKWSKSCFLIAGENDAAVPLIQSKEMISNIQNGDSIILPQTGHMGFIERHRESFEFIKSYIARHIN